METLEIGGIHQDYMSIHYQDGGIYSFQFLKLSSFKNMCRLDAKVPKLNKLGGTGMGEDET